MFKVSARFLVIDDTHNARSIVHQGLQQLGYKNIDDAENGRVGLEKIKKSLEEKSPYALVFCDVNMPEVNGLELLEKLRESEETQGTPVIMITTESAKAVVVRAVLQGISGYMVKPFTPHDVKLKVTETFQRLKLDQTSTV